MARLTDPWVSRPETQAVFSALKAAGQEGFFVGGCVRNALLGHPVKDIDIATAAEPNDIITAAENAGFKPVPTGYEHGTITVVSGGVPHEITTFRRDVETDGRHARVVFGGSMAQDAARRDFTMNALYADSSGAVIDPLNGLPDLQARRVRFIGKAQDRIREDYLRSLRFFRFHAWYGDPAEGLDPDALSAIAGNLDGLDRLSRERVGAEILKLLAAPDPAPAVAAMRATGVLGQVLPGTDDRLLAPLVHLEPEPEPLRRLALLGGSDLRDALRLSNAQAKHLDTLRDGMATMAPPAELAYRHGLETPQNILLLRSALNGSPPDLSAAEHGANAQFPLKAADLMPHLQGPALGQELARLETIWIASGFTLTRDDLLAGAKRG